MTAQAMSSQAWAVADVIIGAVLFAGGLAILTVIGATWAKRR